MKHKMRLIVLGVPHTQTNTRFNGCAFTQKVVKFLKMMSGRGHEIIHLGHELSVMPDNDGDITHYTVVTDADHRHGYGDEYVDSEAWRKNGFAHYYDINDTVHQTFHKNAISIINDIKQPNDLLLCFWGFGHKAVADAIPDVIAVEPGIGYPGAWARWRVYESHSVMNGLAGPDAVQYCKQNWYHRVIGNYFDAEDFTYSRDKDDYLLYIGRIGSHKGVDVAVEVAKHTGQQLVVAGQGSLAQMGITDVPANVVEFGYADMEQRRTLMSRARAVFIASTYMEPFAGVQVEAWLSGTPVISPDWAAFAEMNVNGVTGYRCHTFRDFVDATQQVDQLRPEACRAHGEQWLLENIAPQYEKYFTDVLNVYTGKGWYTL